MNIATSVRMTADAFAFDWDRTSKCEAGDPDATWVDMFKGQRGRKLPGAKTAFLAPAATHCLVPDAPVVAPDIAGLPAANTCLGQLVDDQDLPREDVATVFAFEEGVMAAVSSPANEPSDLPGLKLGMPRALTPQSSPSLGDVLVQPVVEAPALVPDSSPAVKETPSGEAPRVHQANPGPGVPDARLQAGLQARCAPCSVVAEVPTWAGCATQMEGPGVWIDDGLAVPAQAPRVAAAQRAPAPAPVPQAFVPTQIAVLAAGPTAKVRILSARNPLEDVLPFGLVLVAISLATAALVGAYI